MSFGILTTLALGTGCGKSAAPARTSSPPPERVSALGIETGDLDRSADPCGDFFEFATGAWHAANPIPEGKPRWSRRIAAREANKVRVQELLTTVAAEATAPQGSVEQLLGDYYASCTNEDAIETAGTAPLAPLLAEIEGMKERADVERVIRRLHELAITAPFRVAGALDHQEPNRFIASITRGDLGMPSREHYVDAAPRFAEARDRYRGHVAKQFELTGMPAAQATRSADLVLGFEKRLAQASLAPAAASDPLKTYHKTTFAELARLAPHFDWARYFDEAKLPRDAVNVAEPKLLQQVDHELAHAPVAAWKAYLTSRLLAAASPSLSRAFVTQSFEFEGRYLGGAAEMKPRAVRCMESTETLLGDALGKKFVEKHFPPAAKAKVQDIINNLLAVLKAEIPTVEWMTPETRRKALAKLATYRVEVGYPDSWKNHAGLVIRRDTFWANVAAARRRKVEEDRQRVGKPTDPLWELTSAATVSPYIDLQLNTIVLQAAYLAPPIFNLDANDAVNYGSIGVSVAHDLTHAIDLLGAENDPAGRPQNWWTDADRNQFAKRGQCVIDQYEGYFIEPGVHHDGKRVLGESVGDLAGLKIAYRALARSMKTRPVATVDGFTPEQQFFIASAQSRGEAVRLEAQREIVKSDSHPVSRFRVNGPLSNMPEFHTAFSCGAGAAMVRPPEKRCAVW